MTKYTLLLILASFVFSFYSFSQSSEKKLNAWSSQNPIEKLYVQTDRENYYSGETVWLKAYFMSEFIPSVASSTLFVELLNNEHQIILRNVFPVYGGTSPGQMELPDTLFSGRYQLRAYSRLMLNQPGYVFNKNGMPLQVDGVIKNSKDEIISSFKSLHDGMGTFEIMPSKDETYYVTLKNSTGKYSLPDQAENGIVFNVTSEPGRKIFKILSGGNDDHFKPAYMIGQIQNHVIFKQSLQSDKKENTGFIKTTDFYSGILHLTIFNKDDIPLAERITFIDNKEYVLEAELKADTFDNNKRKLNHFSIALQDTVIGNFSVSVTDADYETTETRPVNIYSGFLLNSDVRGYVHHPSFYFNSNEDSVKNLVELVMMTNGWRRFKWTNMRRNNLSEFLHKESSYIKLSGRINIVGTRKPLANQEVIVFFSPFDSSKISKSISRIFRTDSSGHFEIDSLLFYNKTKMLFSEIRGKKNKIIHVTLDPDSLHQLHPVVLNALPTSDTSFDFIQKKMDVEYKGFWRGRDILLENIVVKAKQKTPIEKLDEEYSRGLFSGNIYSRRLDVRDENYGGNIFQYLQERIMGLKISGEPGNYSLNYRGGNLTYYLGADESSGNKAEPSVDAGNVSLFLNEMQTSAVALETISMNDIALVKLFPNSLMSAGNGAALAVYTKKEADLVTSADAPSDMIIYNGYEVVKEFYSPDYNNAPANSEKDFRITLSWNADVFVRGTNSKIPVTFYNNDRTKRLKIVAEGITADGRMLMLEKIIEEKK